MSSAWSLNKLQRYDEASALINDHLHKFPKDSEILINLGYFFYKADKNPEALNALNRGLALDRHNKTGLYRRALVNINLKSHESVVSDLSRVIAIDPGFNAIWVRYNLGNAYLELEQYENAIDRYKESYRISPLDMTSNEYYYRNLGASHYNLKQYESAVEIYRQGLRQFPLSQQLTSSLGWSLYYINDLQGAVATVRSFLANHSSPRMEIDLGFYYFELNQLDKALARTNNGLASIPGDKSGLYRRGLIHLRKSRYKEAAADLEQIAGAYPDLDPTWVSYNLANAYKNIGKHKQALALFEKAYALSPDELSNQRFFYLNLGHTYQQNEMLEKAIMIYEDGLARFPEDELLHDTLGGAYNVSGNHALAVEHYKKAAYFGYMKIGTYPDAELSLPFKGTGKITQGNNGTASHMGLSGTYSWDITILNKKLLQYWGDEKRNQSHYCFGYDVIAPGDGVVDKVVSGIDDNPEVGIKNPNWPAGNFVRIKHSDNLYSTAAHLRKDSVTVSRGQSVKEGQKIGECGNSGYSTGPHIHFTVMFGPDHHFASRPTTFLNYEKLSGNSWQRISRGVPAKNDKIRNPR
jgi:tetratricopeptide (TPR) repeat protein